MHGPLCSTTACTPALTCSPLCGVLSPMMAVSRCVGAAQLLPCCKQGLQGWPGSGGPSLIAREGHHEQGEAPQQTQRRSHLGLLIDALSTSYVMQQGGAPQARRRGEGERGSTPGRETHARWSIKKLRSGRSPRAPSFRHGAAESNQPDARSDSPGGGLGLCSQRQTGRTLGTT